MPEDVLSPYLTDSADMRQHFVSSGPYYIKTYVPGQEHRHRSGRPATTLPATRFARPTSTRSSVDETVGSDESEIQQIQAGTADYSLDITLPAGRHRVRR